MKNASPKPTLLCFHGSPGNAADFSLLAKELADWNLQISPREGYPAVTSAEDTSVVSANDASHYIAYSWGSVPCLLEAARNTNTQKTLVLVSPFLSASKPLSGVMKFVLSLPLIGETILNKAATKAISEFLTKSCSPDSVPEPYKNQTSYLKQPTVLKTSLFEKNISLETIKNACDILNAQGTKVLIISGAKDHSEHAAQHVSSLKSMLQNLEIHEISDGGHALTWTKPNATAVQCQKFFGRSLANKSSSSAKIGYAEGTSARNNVFNFILAHEANHPHKAALKWVLPDDLSAWKQNAGGPLPHTEISFAQLAATIRKVAAGLQDLGICKGDRVILFVPMSPALYSAMFALQMIGAIPVFLDSWARRQHLGMSAQTVNPKAMISFQKAFELCSEVPELSGLPIKICIGAPTDATLVSFESLKLTARDANIEPVEKEHTALITFTTGSSGVPKGANRTHRFLAAQHYALDKCIPYEDSDVDLPVFPIFSLNNVAGGVTTIIPAIDVGTPSSGDAQLLCAQIEAAKVTCVTLSPSLFNGVAAYSEAQNQKITRVRRTVTGGAPVSLDNVKSFKFIAPNSAIWILYGSTEAEPMAHIEAVEMIALSESAPADSEIIEDGVNVGHFADDLEYKFIKILKGPVSVKQASDWRSLEVPTGVVGELIVAGEHVCREYFNNQDAFLKSKILDERGVVWHRTGDLGRQVETGHLWIVGRVHNAIERGGIYYFPVKAEILLKRFEFVKHAAYLGIHDAALGEKTACVVVPVDASALSDESKLTEWKLEIERVMAKNKLPVDLIKFLDKIPMDPRHNSKVEYESLRQQIQSLENP